MTSDLTRRLFAELEALVLIDPHSHINPHAAASTTLADIMGYHYYTELAHSAGLPKDRIEQPGLHPKEKVGRLVEKLTDLDNTIQVSWLIDMCQEFFGFQDDRITTSNWESLYDAAEKKMAEADWEQQCLKQSKLEAVFLTNDFDDPLEGFDTSVYIPCLRTDDLVFKLDQPAVRARLAKATGIEVGDRKSLKAAIRKLFEHFVAKGAKACAISLPPWFSPIDLSDEETGIDDQLKLVLGDQETLDSYVEECGEDAVEEFVEVAMSDYVSSFIFWTIAECCDEFKLPFDLMIGVNRQVYPAGVFQGQDLFDKQVSLIQYRDLFNAFPNVTFPVSVLGHTSNQELVSYSWIFPNVVTNGHWWYSNIPTYIEADTRSRLEAVPRNKQVGYYSDMYKLEFALPKFRMYRRILAQVLATDFVIGRGWSEDRALDFGRQVLRGNVESIFQCGTSR
ncbi:MAG: glucuronate isomerase [Planctomycetaceae bacterium]